MGEHRGCSPITHVEKNGKTFHLWKASLQDNTNDVLITFFGSSVDHTEEKTLCSFTNLTVLKYMFTRPLNTTGWSKIIIPNQEIRIDKENLSDSMYLNKFVTKLWH